jgi:hypothetical protein
MMKAEGDGQQVGVVLGGTGKTGCRWSAGSKTRSPGQDRFQNRRCAFDWEAPGSGLQHSMGRLVYITLPDLAARGQPAIRPLCASDEDRSAGSFCCPDEARKRRSAPSKR